jgi:hypothetical protein
VGIVRTEKWGNYLDLGDRKLQEDEKKYKTRRIVIIKHY